MAKIINGVPAWKVVMDIDHTELRRPRFFSLQALAALTGRRNLKKLAEEMRDSEKVIGCYCPVVRALVFCSDKYKYRYSFDYNIWDRVDKFIADNPYPQVKGFRANTPGSWSGGKWGSGIYLPPPSTAMDKPFCEEDYIYANTLIDVLKSAGYRPGIKKYLVTEGAKISL